MTAAAIAPTQAVRAQIQNFSATRGGFAVAPQFDLKIFIDPKLTNIHFKRGDYVDLEVEVTPREPRATRVITAEASGFVAAIVKYFDGAKDYGFLTLPNKKDVFFHGKTLRRNKIEANALTSGARIEVAYANTPRGFHATALRLA